MLACIVVVFTGCFVAVSTFSVMPDDCTVLCCVCGVLSPGMPVLLLSIVVVAVLQDAVDSMLAVAL